MKSTLNPIRDLSSWVSRLMPKSGQALSVLSVDGQWLRLLHTTGRSSTRTVANLLAHPIEGLSDDEVLAWLKETCAAKGVEPDAVLIANPSPLTTTRLFTLPSTDPAEIRDIVELQAEKHTPYAKEEILTDFRIVEMDRAGYSRVLLVISHQDIVHRALRLVEGMGWLLERVGFELEGLANWFQVASQAASREGALVADLTGDATTLVILQGGRPYFHRSLSLGVNHLFSDPKDGPARLLAEFQRSLETFEAEGLNLPVTRVVLTGQAKRFPGLDEHIRQGLDLPTSVVQPFEGYHLLEQTALEGDVENQVSFTSLLGLAFGESEVDLTPKALKLHRAFEARAKALMGVGCQVIGMVLLFSCFVIGKGYKVDRYHAKLLHEYQATAVQAQDLEGVLERVEFVKGWLSGRGQLLNALIEITQHTPAAIQWEAVTFTRGEQVVIKGVSEEIPKIYDFAAALKRSPLFTGVEARKVAKRKTGKQDVTEFELVCSLPSPEKTADVEKTNPRG